MKKFTVFSSVVTMVVGIVMVCAGIGGMVYTHNNIARENITTPDDASIPRVLVKGPLTLKAQADIIRRHTLTMTDGKTFAEMPRQIPKIDADGKPMLDKDSKPIMVANTTRDIWITATTLITALNLGIIAYAFSGLVSVLGIVFVLIGKSLYILAKR